MFALVRNPDDEQNFAVEFLHGGIRHYRAPERDALLATLLDGVRSSGNRDVHVRSSLTNRALRLTPLWQAPDLEVVPTNFFCCFNLMKLPLIFIKTRLNRCTFVG